jgi:hypothetical protein
MRPARLKNGVVHPVLSPVKTGAHGHGTRAESVATKRPDWSREEAEEALRSLKGVISARIVLQQKGKVEEIHLLTESDVTPKKTVRRVESTFLTRFGLRIDHRKVSVAQSRWSVGDEGKKAKSSASFLREPTPFVVDRPAMPPVEPRMELRFDGHEVELEGSGRMRVRVYLDTLSGRYSGEAVGSQRASSRMKLLATATLSAVRASLRNGAERNGPVDGGVPLALDDVDVIDAFEKDYVLASLNAIGSDEVTSLAGVAPVEGSLDRAVIDSTLQAADRWFRDQV